MDGKKVAEVVMVGALCGLSYAMLGPAGLVIVGLMLAARKK